MHHIKTTLPDIKQKISQSLTKYETELASLGGAAGGTDGVSRTRPRSSFQSSVSDVASSIIRSRASFCKSSPNSAAISARPSTVLRLTSRSMSSREELVSPSFSTSSSRTASRVSIPTTKSKMPTSARSYTILPSVSDLLHQNSRTIRAETWFDFSLGIFACSLRWNHRLRGHHQAADQAH